MCGKGFKLLTEKHLAMHGFTRATYRAACGYAPGASLTCSELREARAKKMGEMKLWERRKNGGAAFPEVAAGKPEDQGAEKAAEKAAKAAEKVPADADNL